MITLIHFCFAQHPNFVGIEFVLDFEELFLLFTRMFMFKAEMKSVS